MTDVAEAVVLNSSEAELEEIFSSKEKAVFLNRSYIDQSFPLVTDALKKGFDVTQMPNGDVMVTEVKSVTYRYQWNVEKDCFERVSANARRGRRKQVAKQA